MDSPASPETPSATVSPSSAADKARARRERIQAKLKTQGSSRLSKITATQGSSHLYEDKPAPAVRSPPASVSNEDFNDPPIVLPEHYYTPRSSSNMTSAPTPSLEDMFGGGSGGGIGPSEADMQALMAMYGGGAQQQQQQQRPDISGIPDDPMMAILQQMMGGAGAVPMGPGVGMQQPAQGQGGERWGVLWKVLHAVGALMLAVLSLRGTGWGTAYDGSLGERVMATENTTKFFYYFATMELVLQSSRFLFEKGRPPSDSKLAMVGQLLPQPFGLYLITLSRYSVIWTTIVNDALLVLFVVGMVSWWNSGATTVV